MTRFDFRIHHHNIFVDWVYWFSSLFWILRFPPPGTPRGYYSQGFWGTREHDPVSGKLMWEQLKILFEGRCWLWEKVVGRFVEQGTNLEKLWAHGNTGQIFWKGTRTPGRPSNTCCIACFTKRKKKSQRNHGVLDKYLKMEKEVIKQDKQRWRKPVSL